MYIWTYYSTIYTDSDAGDLQVGIPFDAGPKHHELDGLGRTPQHDVHSAASHVPSFVHRKGVHEWYRDKEAQG
jgi:hypothetical protein